MSLAHTKPYSARDIDDRQDIAIVKLIVDAAPVPFPQSVQATFDRGYGSGSNPPSERLQRDVLYIRCAVGEPRPNQNVNIKYNGGR